MKIIIKENEQWWGGTVHDGTIMPFGNNDFSRDLSKDQQSNQSSPLLLSSCGRYIWSDHPFSFSVSSKEILVDDRNSRIEVYEGFKNLKGAHRAAALKHFNANTRLPANLMFALPQYNTWIEMMYEPAQQKILSYAEDLIKNGFAPGVMIIDDNWQEDYGNWVFHKDRFHDPGKMIEKLHTMGFKVMLWVCNFVSPDSCLFRDLLKKEMLVSTEGNHPAIAQWWNGYSGMLDITNPETVDWFCSKLDYLMNEFGIDGFKFDSGDMEHYEEHFISHDLISSAEYSELWAEIGLKYSFNEYRACWKQGGAPLAQRLCDKNHSWSSENGLGSLIPDGIAQGLMGYYYSCPDMIGGGEYINFLENSNSLDEELIVRNAQCAALFPMMQFSVAPWRILDREHLRYCVEASKIHEEFALEILELAKIAACENQPIIRHMEYEFPHQGFDHIKDQFMLGPDLLVAPVLNKGIRSRTVFFPEGEWEGDDGTKVQGPVQLQIDAPLSRLPRFRKQKK